MSTSAPAVPASPSPPRRVVSEPPVNEVTELARFGRLKKIISFQTWAISGLGLIMLLILPFAHPIDLYFAMNPQRQILQMVGLDVPNMTNQAVLSWATTSITEIMTMGFGDIDIKLPRQKWRFTKTGWDAYINAFINQKIGETFRHSQLVLTTVPSNTPVIVAQGVNENQVYQWNIQMPVIMTYATNNNVTKRQPGFVNLKIIRVAVEDSPTGIAIESWSMENP